MKRDGRTPATFTAVAGQLSEPIDPRCVDCGAAGVEPVASVVQRRGGRRAVLACRRHAGERRARA
jgi:hypothetical protein